MSIKHDALRTGGRRGSVCRLLLILRSAPVSGFGLHSCSAEPAPLFPVGTNLRPVYTPFCLAWLRGRLDEASYRPVILRSATQVIRGLWNESLEAAARLASLMFAAGLVAQPATAIHLFERLRSPEIGP